MTTSLHYLALGDSYTIGEQVPNHENYPNQTVQLLRAKGYALHAPEIIAVTGHTTDELNGLIGQLQLLPPYDVVSLLIGVNNQYRGRTVEDFEKEFQALLQKAIAFAGNRPSAVFVLSIPDWGVTPFAREKDQEAIANAIDAYNAVCRSQALQAGCTYINITDEQRRDGNLPEFLAQDQLHPSGLEYQKWATQLSSAMDLYLEAL